MADPSQNLSLLDIYDKPQGEAAAKVLARAMALQRERALGLADMYTPVPEFQRAGEAQFNRAEKERESVNERMPASALTLSLGKERNAIAQMQAEREYAALRQQIQYQNMQMALQTKQFEQLVKHQGLEDLFNEYRQVVAGARPTPPGLIEKKAKAEAEVARIQGGVLGQMGPLGKSLAKVLSRGPAAEAKAIEAGRASAGMREPPTFEEFLRAKGIGPSGVAAPPPGMPAAQPGPGVSAAVPQAPTTGGLTAGAPAAAEAPQLPAPGPDGRIPIKRKGVPGRVKVEKFNPETDELVSP